MLIHITKEICFIQYFFGAFAKRNTPFKVFFFLFWGAGDPHTWYLSFFLNGQHFGCNLSPHRKCVNRDKTGFATKLRKLKQNRICDKTA